MQDVRKEKGFGLHCFTILTALVTFPLIFIGGLVTSHDVAMAVPDWPTTYGYNMFLFPWEKWIGGIFWEHSHRLFGSLLGVLAIIQTIWLLMHEKRRRWLRTLGLTVLALIIFQGILGGYRVLLNFKAIAFFHACLAQIVFCILCSIVLFTSNWWKQQRPIRQNRDDHLLRRWTIWTTVIIFIQLILGALMRHTDSGLAIPDFPLMYGSLLPPAPEALERINDQRIWHWGLDRITYFQIMIHLFHRIWAVVVTVSIFMTFRRIWNKHPTEKALLLPVGILAALLLLQISLGAFVIWTGKAADIATTHVAVGALMLAGSVLLTLVSYKLTTPVAATDNLPLAAGEGATG